MKYLFFFIIINSVTPAKTYNIKDYLSEIPDNFLTIYDAKTGNAIIRNNLLNYAKEIDVKNGYIHISSEILNEELTIVLFRKKDKSPLLGLSRKSALAQNIIFIEKSNKTWIDVTNKVLPTITNEFILEKYNKKRKKGEVFTSNDLTKTSHLAVLYKLPQKGTTILGIAGIQDARISDTILFELKFENDKFLIVEDKQKNHNEAYKKKHLPTIQLNDDLLYEKGPKRQILNKLIEISIDTNDYEIFEKIMDAGKKSDGYLSQLHASILDYYYLQNPEFYLVSAFKYFKNNTDCLVSFFVNEVEEDREQSFLNKISKAKETSKELKNKIDELKNKIILQKKYIRTGGNEGKYFQNCKN